MRNCTGRVDGGGRGCSDGMRGAHTRNLGEAWTLICYPLGPPARAGLCLGLGRARHRCVIDSIHCPRLAPLQRKRSISLCSPVFALCICNGRCRHGCLLCGRLRCCPWSGGVVLVLQVLLWQDGAVEVAQAYFRCGHGSAAGGWYTISEHEPCGSG